MKKLIALIMVCVFCMATAYAAEWAEGLSPAHPYEHKPEINLDEMIGYMTLYPNRHHKIVAEHFCDVLEMYFPREDIVLGEGNLTLCNASGEVVKISFADSDSVEVRSLEEVELDGLLWGGGSCIEVHLPFSLNLNEEYYVLMEEGCFTASEGKVTNPQIANPDAWTPQVTGDYGVSNLYYSAPVETEATEEEGEAEDAAVETATDAPAEVPDGEVEYKLVPGVGDQITFDIVIGGDATAAVVYSENDSVFFETPEYTQSGTVTGTITGEELDWGVVFLDEVGEVLYNIDMK